MYHLPLHLYTSIKKSLIFYRKVANRILTIAFAAFAKAVNFRPATEGVVRGRGRVERVDGRSCGFGAEFVERTIDGDCGEGEVCVHGVALIVSIVMSSREIDVKTHIEKAEADL